MNENEIIHQLTSYLKAQNYTVCSTANTSQTGYDLKACNSAETLYVEAKGATSSKAGTTRYGKPFSGSQVLSHVSRALFTAMRMYCDDRLENNKIIALALPDDKAHNNLMDKVKMATEKLTIRIYWVSSDHVRVE